MARQSRDKYLRLSNGSGGIISFLGAIKGDPTMPEWLGPANRDGVIIPDGRGGFLGIQDGDQATYAFEVECMSGDQDDCSADDAVNFIQFTGAYAAHVGVAANPGNYKALKAEVIWNNAGVHTQTIDVCKVKISPKSAADHDSFTVSVEGYTVTGGSGRV